MLTIGNANWTQTNILKSFSKKDDEDESERDWKGEAKEASRRLQEERQEVTLFKKVSKF